MWSLGFSTVVGIFVCHVKVALCLNCETKSVSYTIEAFFVVCFEVTVVGAPTGLRFARDVWSKDKWING